MVSRRISGKISLPCPENEARQSIGYLTDLLTVGGVHDINIKIPVRH